MTLERFWQQLSIEKRSYDPLLIASVVDLTLLDKAATPESLQELQKRAQRFHVAAVCIHIDQLPQLINQGSYKHATVVNFPDATSSNRIVADEIIKAITNGANEIDYVFSYALYIENPDKALANCYKACLLAHQNSSLFKVILETGKISSLETVYSLSLQLLDLGVDFLKTSTGKFRVGATPAAVFAMLKAIADSNIPCGLKVSGGIKTLQDASVYMCLSENVLRKKIDKSWFRLGSSSVLDSLDRCNQSHPHY